MAVTVTMKELLEAGVHFGHQVRRWNPKMKEYIFGERNGIYIIDLQKTQRMFRDAIQFVTNLVGEDRGKTVLFVTHSIPEAVFLSTRIVVMTPRPGRIIDVIDCNFPSDRTLDFRDTKEFLGIAHRVRDGLRAGHSYDI